jgi:MFS family permease
VPEQDRPRRHAGAVLASAVAANFGQFGARVVISPFVLAIAATFAVSTGEVGIVLTLLWATFALFQFPGGVLADRYGERRVILAALALTTAGSLAVTAAPSFPLFALATLLLGAGAGLYFVVGTSLLSRRFDRTGLALSLHASGGPIAGLVLPVVATAVAATHGWRVGVATGAVVAGLAFLVVIVGVGATPASNPTARLRDRLSVATVRSRLARPAVAFTTVIGVLGMYAFQSFVSFYPAFLQDYHGLSERASGLAFGVAFVLIAVCMPLVGTVADRWDTDGAIAVPMVVTVAGLGVVLVPLAGPDVLGIPATVHLGSVVAGVGLTWGGAYQARAIDLFDAADRATGFGVMRTTYVLVGASGNVITGVLAARVGWPAAIGAIGGVLALAVGLLVANRLVGTGW